MAGAKHRGPRSPAGTSFLVLILVYGIATLAHFVHNAEFIADYPGMPASWTREVVYFAWLGLTAVGVLGGFLVARGYQVAGLPLVAIYAALGLDSLGHYVLAPMSAHTSAMNATILVEVIAAALLLAEVARMMVWRALRGGQRA